MAISVSMIAVGSQLIVAVANGVPVFDVTRTCKLDVSATAGLSENQSIQACIKDEKRAHPVQTEASSNRVGRPSR